MWRIIPGLLCLVAALEAPRAERRLAAAACEFVVSGGEDIAGVYVASPQSNGDIWYSLASDPDRTVRPTVDPSGNGYDFCHPTACTCVNVYSRCGYKGDLTPGSILRWSFTAADIEECPVDDYTYAPSRNSYDNDDDDDDDISPMMTSAIAIVAFVLCCLPLCCCCLFRVEEVESVDKVIEPAVGFCCCCVAPFYQVEGVRPKDPCCWEASATEEGAAPGVRQFVERRTMVCQTPCIPESVRKVSAVLLATANVAILVWLLRVPDAYVPIAVIFLLSAICFGTLPDTPPRTAAEAVERANRRSRVHVDYSSGYGVGSSTLPPEWR